MRETNAPAGPTLLPVLIKTRIPIRRDQAVTTNPILITKGRADPVVTTGTIMTDPITTETVAKAAVDIIVAATVMAVAAVDIVHAKIAAEPQQRGHLMIFPVNG